MSIFLDIFPHKKKNNWEFKGEYQFKFNFRISFPIKNGYQETSNIKVIIPANSEKEAKKKLNKFVKSKIKVTVISCKQI